MGRFKSGNGRKPHTGISNKQDTPLKAALPRRSKYQRLLPIKYYDALPEESELEEIIVPTVNTSIHLSTSVSTPAKLKSEDQVWTSNVDIQTKTEQEPFDCGETGRRPQNLTLKDISSSSFKTDMSGFEEEVVGEVVIEELEEEEEEEENESEEEEDEYCCPSSETSSSLPSPEIFREENYESSMLPIEEDLTGFPFNVKNSTLLDLSHARSIHMHQPPNLSIITDTPALLTESTCEISNSRRPAEESKVHVDSGTKASKKKTPQAPVMRRPITYKKKVWFRSPLSDNSNRKTTSATIINTTETVQPCCPHEQIKPDRDTSREGEISNGIMLPLGKAGKSGPEQVKVFDFVNKSALDVMLQKMRERCAKLKNVPLFPLTPAK